MSVNRYRNGKLDLIAGNTDPSTFTGTRAQVDKAIADGIIQEGWTVYITDDVQTPMVNVDTLTTMEEVEACDDPETPVGAGAVKELNDNLEEVNNSLEWKLVGQATKNSEITLPTSFNELYAEVKNSAANYHYAYNIPYIALTDDSKSYFTGFYLSTGTYTMCQIKCSKTKVYVEALTRTGKIETDSAVFTVYYR